MHCFARQITSPQLREYVHSLPFCKVQWVPSYNWTYCGGATSSTSIKEVVFVQTGPNVDVLTKFSALGIKIWILNTEQLSRVVNPQEENVPFDFEAWVFCYVRSSTTHATVHVMDYSYANIQIWKRLFPDLKVRYMPFVPVFVTPWSAPVMSGKPAVFVGDASSSYRHHILQQLDDIVDVVENVYGETRDEVLSRYAIIVNIHFGPSYTIFEELRCLPCVLQKRVVVSEASFLDTKHPLHRFIVFAPYERLVRCVQRAVKHLSELQAKLYSNKKHDFLLLQNIQDHAQKINAA